MALALAGFAIGIVAHDRELASEAFDRALALSPSCALVLFMGSSVVSYGGDAERAIDWGERAIRLSPLDAMNYIPHCAIGLGQFLLGRHEEAIAAFRRGLQLNPGFSGIYVLLASPLIKLGRSDEARAAAAQLFALDPGFSISRWTAAVGVAPRITDIVNAAMRQAGLPE